MRNLKGRTVFVFVTIALGLVADYIRVRSKDSRVFAVVSQCGGRCGSIPVWPLGTEYRISFQQPLTSHQLDQLVELNSLRGWVGVAFVECEISAAEIDVTEKKLSICHLFRVIDGEMRPLNFQKSRAH